MMVANLSIVCNNIYSNKIEEAEKINIYSSFPRAGNNDALSHPSPPPLTRIYKKNSMHFATSK